MLPIILTEQKNAILVIGEGPATTNRLKMLDAAGMHYTHQRHSGEGQSLSEAEINEANPEHHDVVFVADFDVETSAKLYAHYKAQGALVNVEDKRDYCDFHVPAIVRRGDLLLTISTGGGSPRLARRLRMMLETLFPPAWAQRLKLIETKRTEWKGAGLGFTQVADKTDELMDSEGWLNVDCACVRASSQTVMLNSFQHPSGHIAPSIGVDPETSSG